MAALVDGVEQGRQPERERCSTPTIWTIVTTRKTQSSVSKAEANQEKLIQAQMIAKTAMAKAMRPVPT